MMPENFISMEMVVAAAFDRGLVRGNAGSLDIAPLVGELTGLDMRKYDLVQDVNLYGWRIVRKVDEERADIFVTWLHAVQAKKVRARFLAEIAEVRLS